MDFTGDSTQVSPTADSTMYTVMYTNGVNDTCYDSLAIYVEQPSIVASVFPFSMFRIRYTFCTSNNSANCYYQLECWNYLPPPGAQNLGGKFPIQTLNNIITLI